MEGVIGEIRGFAGNFAPRNWAFCEGQLLAISSNTALYSILGTIYGGDGRTTFALPDLRGRTMIGPGNGPGLPSYRQGQRGGNYHAQLSVSNLPSHNHAASVTGLSGAVDIPVNSTDGDADAQSPASGVLANTGEDLYSSSSNGSYSGRPLPVSMTSGAIQVGLTGGGQAFSIMPPYVPIYYVICMMGIYPSRS